MTLDKLLSYESIGTLIDRVNDLSMNISIKPCNLTDVDKYKVLFDIKSDEVGYITFQKSKDGGSDVIFQGIFIEEKYRGNNYSDAFIEFLFEYSESQSLEFNLTTSQRKPLTNLLLTKYGFYPVDDNPRNLVLYTGKSYDNKMTLKFFDNHKKTEFENSRLMANSHQYKLDDSYKSTVGAIYLGTEYILTDDKMKSGRREKFKDYFDINFI